MTSTPKQLVSAIVSAASSNPNLYNELIQARDLAVSKMLSPNGGNTLTEAQKNGVSYKILVDVPESLRLSILSTAISMIENGTKPTSRTQGHFQ